MEIAKNIKYIGVDDTTIDLFEGQYVVPQGISYNSYFIDDEKTAILDTVDTRKTDEWLQNLEEALGGRTPDYLIIHHMEPDHAASLQILLEKYPQCTGICSQKAAVMIGQFFDANLIGRFQTVKEGDTLQLGTHTLTFVMAPMVHWPEVMVSYESTEGILFSADGFGKFGALNHPDSEGMADDHLHATVEGWACEARRYYFNIVGKYGAMVQALLKKAAPLKINIIAPLHGPIIDKNLDYYINTYDTWSSYRPEDKGIFIAYCSIYGNTRTAALKLADILKEKDPSLKVSTSDIARDDMAEALEDAFRYDRLVVAAPTYDGGVMPVMTDFIHHLAIKAYQNRKVAIIENGSWAPMAAKKMREAFDQMKDITIVTPIVTITSAVKKNNIKDLQTLADALIS